MATWFEKILAKNIHQVWDWDNLSANPNLSFAFIERHLDNPKYKWKLCSLGMHPSVVLFMVNEVEKMLDMRENSEFNTEHEFAEAMGEVLPAKWQRWVRPMVLSYWTKIVAALPKKSYIRLPTSIQSLTLFWALNRTPRNLPKSWKEVLNFVRGKKQYSYDPFFSTAAIWYFISKNPCLATRERIQKYPLPWAQEAFVFNPGLVKTLFETSQIDRLGLGPTSLFRNLSMVGDGRIFCFRQGVDKIKAIYVKIVLTRFVNRKLSK